MKLEGRAEEFVAIGENIHTTRIVLRRGKHVTTTPDGEDAVRFLDAAGTECFLPIPDDIKQSQEYASGKVKHMKIAVQLAMRGHAPEAGLGTEYLKLQIQGGLPTLPRFIPCARHGGHAHA